MIEYSYNFWVNSNIINNPLMFIPFFGALFFIIYFAVKKRFKYTLLSLFVSLILYSYDFYLINDRFIKLNLNTLEITKLNGNVIKIDKKNISKYWAITHSSHGNKYGCHLWLKTKNGSNYNSIIIKNVEACSKHAKYLNEKYKI